MLHGKIWAAVCECVFDQQDAESVSWELDCGLPVEVLGHLLLAKRRARCGQRRFSAEAMNDRFISAKDHPHSHTQLLP